MSRKSAQLQHMRRARRVKILKVSLPLIALAILSSLFLFSRSFTLDGALPFAEIDIADRLREPKMTDVRIATTSANGAVIDISARSITPTDTQSATARSAYGIITAPTGQTTELTALQVDYDDTAATAALIGGVAISSGGYDMTTDAIDVNIDTAEAETRGSVHAIGPLGQLDAGSMRVKQGDGGFVIVFKSGVRLLYTP